MIKLPKLPTKPELLEKASYVALAGTIVKTLSDELHLDQVLSFVVTAIGQIPADAMKMLLWLVVAFYLGVATHGWLGWRARETRSLSDDNTTIDARGKKQKRKLTETSDR
jgi:hypothetical protein